MLEIPVTEAALADLERANEDLSHWKAGAYDAVGWYRYLIYRAEDGAGPTGTPQPAIDRRAEYPGLMSMAKAIPGEDFRIALAKLEPGGILPRHSETHGLHVWESYVAAFHVPLLTNPGCLLLQWIDDKPRALVTKVGAPIFFDWGYDHMAVNGGTTPRVHLYIEKPWCEVLWRFVHALAHSNHRIAVTWT